jgi:hypothetical protein
MHAHHTAGVGPCQQIVDGYSAQPVGQGQGTKQRTATGDSAGDRAGDSVGDRTAGSFALQDAIAFLAQGQAFDVGAARGALVGSDDAPAAGLGVAGRPLDRAGALARARAGIGLSTCHIPPRGSERACEGLSDPAVTHDVVGRAVLRMARGGGLVRVATIGAAPARARSESRRGRVAGYSRRSRRRLMDLTASIHRERAGRPLFVTLTYPRQWDPDPEVWKQDLESFGKRLLRRYPRASFIWRLEFQRRGAPHFHLLMFGADWVPARWLGRSWAEIVGKGTADPDHLRAGVEVKRVRSWRGVASYASKGMAHELGKQDQALSEAQLVGRWWGVVNRSALPVEIVTLVLSWRVFYQVRRLLQKLGGRPGRGRWQGLAGFAHPATIDRLAVWLGG